MKDKSISLEIKKIDSLIVRRIIQDTKKSKYRLTPVQIFIIKYLSKNKNKTIYQKDIEKKIGLRKSTISGIIKTMQKNNIIMSIDSKSDLRSKEIVLTKDGLKLEKLMIKKEKDFEKLLERDIDKNDLEIFFKVTEQIQNNLGGKCNEKNN